MIPISRSPKSVSFATVKQQEEVAPTMSLQSEYTFATGNAEASQRFREQIAEAISTQIYLWLTTQATAPNPLAWAKTHVGQEATLAAQIAPVVASNSGLASAIAAAATGTPIPDDSLQFTVNSVLAALAG